MPETRVPAITRRQGLLALALVGPAGLLAACTSDSASAPSDSASTGGVQPSDAVAEQESALIAQYDTVLATFPDLDPATAAVLGAIRDQHAQHRDALGGADDVAAEAAPATAAAALSALLAAERGASRERIRACVGADSAETARLLALIGASEASHVPALRDLGA
jgi:hypothetical protein